MFSGNCIGSPIAAMNAPSLTQIDTHPTTIVDLNTNNVLASQDTLIGGFGLKKT